MEARDILLYLSLKYQGDWQKIYDAICNHENNVLEDNEIKHQASMLKCHYLTILDEEYPNELKQIFKPPFVLFYYGDISLINNIRNNIAVVGARDCSSYGSKITKEIVSEITNKYVIVSGLAKGIDSVAHQSAINQGGKTVAILGCGIDVCYPLENKQLYDEIKTNHLLLSEYPGKTLPEKSSFPIRNRLIAGLSQAVLVTESKKRSGTMITVNHALQAGRDVLCVPDQAGKESGCNALIKSGAALVENAADVFEQLNNTYDSK